MGESHICLLLLCTICTITLFHQSNAQELDIEAQIVNMKKRAESQTELIKQQQAVIGSLEWKLSELEASSVAAEADVVAFSAYMTDGEHQVPPEGYIPFQGVESNYGNHYDAKESEFICPTTGLYFFTFTLYSAALEEKTDYYISSGTLIVGQKTNVETFNKNQIQSGNVAMQGSNSVIVKCEKDWSVWVASQYTSNQSYGADKARRSTFSGMRVLNLEEKKNDKGSCDS